MRRERRWWEGVRERGSSRWCDLGGQDVGKPRVTPDARKQRYETYDSSLFAVLTSQALLWARVVAVAVVVVVVSRVPCVNSTTYRALQLASCPLQQLYDCLHSHSDPPSSKPPKPR